MSDKDEASEAEHTGNKVDPQSHGHAVAGAKANNLDDNISDDVYGGKSDEKNEEPDGEDKDGDKGDNNFKEIQFDTLKWIKLLVSQFSSTYMLLYGFPNIPVSIEILKSPPVGADLMFWTDLLADSNFFPAGPPIQAGSHLWNNQQIADFLTKGQQADHCGTVLLALEAYKTWEKLLQTSCSGADKSSSKQLNGHMPNPAEPTTNQSNTDTPRLFDAVVSTVSRLRDTTKVPDCNETAKLILVALNGMTASGITMETYIPADPVRQAQVTQHLLYINELCRILSRLVAPKFSGSLHCKAVLGTLISTFINEAHLQYSSLLVKLQQFV
ncbi:hypothetical protein GALMADRAFT_217501 [Galerina marginata CBS 339.88]|uniref:Uncharacterized protein n=1 Tax=Galerina marginata (strain CBS 339.88) TaxID=685588 RepID=A0A067S6N7_GALM3|nr:hypothetical protein GALMADRAFT_217501 [Galerina marginata CBS 339.88]